MKKTMIIRRIVTATCLVSVSVLMLGTSLASTNFFDFNSDPSASGQLTILHRPGASGGATWYPSDGAPSDPNGTNGYFSITDVVASERCTVIFSDFDAGLVVKAFKMSMDIRVGGSGASQPADGFSISYARANDPVLLHNDGTGYACNPSGSECDLEEEGTTTGLSVCFDSYLNGVGDVIGITIRLDNNIITNIPMGVANGGCTNLNSIQTGDTTAVIPDDLCWTKLIVELTTNGLLNLNYKGNAFLTNFPTSFGPSAGRLVLGGRTGDNSQFAHIDNLEVVTIPTTGPAVSSASGNLRGFTVGIDDSGTAKPDTNTLAVQLDGTTIISHGTNVSSGTVSVSQSGITTTINFEQAAIFASGSLHVVHVTFSGTGFSGTVDETRNFIAPTYVTLPTGLWTPLGSGDPTKPGFRIHGWQVDSSYTWVNGYQNELNSTEQVLAGLINTNTVAGASGTNLIDFTAFVNGEYSEPGVINYSSGGDAGAIPGDTTLPGLPGVLGLFDDSVLEMLTFVEFPTNGLYRMGVASDDCFKLTLGDSPGQNVGLRVLAPAGLAGRYFAVSTAMAYGSAFGGALPTTSPLIAQAVLCDPPWPTAAPNNASALAGKIAILHRDPSGGVYAHSIWAQQAGAVGVVVVDQDDDGAGTPVGPTRFVGQWGGGASDFTIPVLTIEYTAGTNLIAHATGGADSPIVLSLGDDPSLRLGQFDAGGGRGALPPSVFDVLVTKAGVYPLRLFWENGGSGASVEWWMVSGDGTTNLINSTTCPIKAYRARSVTTGAAHLNSPRLSGSNAIVSWTGEGELVEAASLTGPWEKSNYQDNPATVPIVNLLGKARYFRIRQY
jgi:hypothetical protein